MDFVTPDKGNETQTSSVQTEEDLLRLQNTYACGLNTYMLNQEPRHWRYTRFLVDGVHWNGHSKTQKGTTNSGHKGCSDGFNFNLYKKHIDKNFNSQGREQTHSILSKLAPSLRNMNYVNFMIVLIRFFGYRNMFLKGIL